MTYSFVEASANNQTVDETELVLVYELGRIFDCLLNREGDLKAFKAFAKAETADFISMSRMLCEQMSWDFNAVYGDDDVEYMLQGSESLSRIFIALSKVIRGNFYVKRFGNARNEDPEESMKVIIQWVKRLCRSMGWEFWELVQLGEERYEERMKDLRECGINSRLKPKYRRKKECPEESACEGCAGDGVC